MAAVTWKGWKVLKYVLIIVLAVVSLSGGGQSPGDENWDRPRVTP